MLHPIRNHRAFPVVGIIALLFLAISCAPTSPVPTQTPLPTYTPYPTPTPQPTYTPYPTPTPEPTATATPTQTPAPDLSTGNWELSEEIDQITDAKATLITLSATESTIELPHEGPHIVISCVTSPASSPVRGIYIKWYSHLGNGNANVDWRVDDERAETREWVIFDQGTALMNRSWPLRDLQKAEQITARVHRNFAESITAVWHTGGFSEAYRPVEEACKQ